MSTSILGQRKKLDSSFDGLDQAEPNEFADRIGALEAEVRKARDETVKLRELIVEREKKGATLNDAYRSVLADMAQLIEVQSVENTKREESLRFFLNSIESRLKADIRSELGIEPEDTEEIQSDWWPFRLFR